MCPHGGTVSIASQNVQASAGGDLIVRSSDTFLIGGCPFMAGSAPHPCMQIQWLEPSSMTQAAEDFTVTGASVGLCVAGDQAPQGAPEVVDTQAQGAGE